MRTLISIISRPIWWTPRFLLLVGIVLGVLGVLSAGRLKFYVETSNLLPAENAVLHDLQLTQKSFPNEETLLLVLQAESPNQLFQLKALGEAMALQLSDDRFVQSVVFRVDQAFYANKLQQRLPELVNFLSRADWQTAVAALQPDAIERSLGVLKTQRMGRRSFLPLYDPLGVFTSAVQRINRQLSPLTMPSREGYFISEDGLQLHLLLRINGSSSDLGFCLRLIEFIEQTATVVLQLEAEEVRWFAQGAFVDRVTNYRQIQRDILRIAGISGILVSALLLIAYRRATIFLSLGFPLICFFGVALGAISTLGIHLSPITFCCLCSLTLLLLTMAVHLHDRYITEATASPDHRDNALRRAVILAGQGNLMATLIITAIGVQLLWFDLPDFMTAGWIIIAGAIFSFLSVQLLTSASIKVFILPTRRRSVSLHITNLGVGRIAWGAMAFPRACLAMVAMVACYNAWYALNLNYSPTVLPEATLQTQNSVADWRQARRMKPVPKHVHLVLKGESMEELLQENDRLFAYISRQLDAPDIEIFSLRNILPSLKSQEESRKKLLETREFNDANLTRQLEEAASEAGLNFEPVFGEFLKYLESMRQYATSGPYIRWSDLRDYQLKRGIQRYLSKDNNQLVVLTRVSAPSETMRREVSSLLPELKRTFPGIVVSSLQEVENEYQRLLQRSLALLMIISYLTLAGLFLLLLKQFRLTVLVLIVMSLVLVLYLGTIQLSGLSLSPLLVGMALVVNSMMLVNVCQFLARLRDPTGEFDFTSEQSNKWYYRAIEYTGRSIMLSHLVLAVIFITLLLADRTELLILGRTGFFINAQAFIATLGVLPCLLAILGPENSKVSDLVGSDDPTWLHEMFATQTSSKPV